MTTQDPKPPLAERLLVHLRGGRHVPFDVLYRAVSYNDPAVTQQDVKDALYAMVRTGELTLHPGRGFAWTPADVEVAWNDLRVLDINSGIANGASETRLQIGGVPGYTPWYAKWSTDNMSGGDWQDDDGGTVVTPFHVKVTGVPAWVYEATFDLVQNPCLDDVIEALVESAEDAYWPVWRETVLPAERELKSRVLPFVPDGERA